MRRKLTNKIKHIKIPVNPSNNPKNIRKDSSKWKIIDTPEEVLAALITQNGRYFGQAETEGTPFF